MHGLAVFVYRITASNNIPADLMKEEKKINSNEKDAGFVPAEANSNFFLKTPLFPPSCRPAGGREGRDLNVVLPVDF